MSLMQRRNTPLTHVHKNTPTVSHATVVFTCATLLSLSKPHQSTQHAVRVHIYSVPHAITTFASTIIR